MYFYLSQNKTPRHQNRTRQHNPGSDGLTPDPTKRI